MDLARDNNVDFVLLGGDLFHSNRPSPAVEHTCIKIIRQHMNAAAKKNVTFKRISGEFSHIQKVKHANFEDPNIIVPCPILTIHGNHDDPTGPLSQTVCEKLATCGLLNYFGADHSKPGQKRVVEPIVLQKGEIKIAIYGMGFIPDLKLRVALEDRQVVFVDPPPDSYNILVVHQNRVPHNKFKVIEDDLYPDFFHLIVRGHEHDCQPPQSLPQSRVNGLVYQPGSTVATSVSVQEHGNKRVGLFHVSKNPNYDVPVSGPSGDVKQPRYNVNYELKSLINCRDMIMKDVYQKEILVYLKKEHRLDKCTSLEYRTYSKKYVEEQIEKLLKDHSIRAGAKHNHFKLPLVRIRLEYSSKAQRFDEIEIRSKFYPQRVANDNIVLFKKQKIAQNESGQTNNLTFIDDDCDDDEDIESGEYIDIDEEQKESIEIQVSNYFKDKPPSQRPVTISLDEYMDAINASEGGSAIMKIIKQKRTDTLLEFNLAVGDEENALEKFHSETQVEAWFLDTFGSNLSQQDRHKLSG